MSPIIDLLRSEIARLQAELSDAIEQRLGTLEHFDSRIAEIQQRLQAAERMLAIYIGAPPNGDSSPGGVASHQPSQDPASVCYLTASEIETATLPATVRARQLRPGAKRTRIIRSAKAFLERKETATRGEILHFLQKHGIMGSEKDPAAYLSVILSYANEIFSTDGRLWSLKQGREASSPVDLP